MSTTALDTDRWQIYAVAWTATQHQRHGGIAGEGSFCSLGIIMPVERDEQIRPQPPEPEPDAVTRQINRLIAAAWAMLLVAMFGFGVAVGEIVTAATR